MMPAHHLLILENLCIADQVARRFSRHYPLYAEDFKGEAYLLLCEWFNKGGENNPKIIATMLARKLITYTQRCLLENRGTDQYFVDIDECHNLRDTRMVYDDVEEKFVYWGLDMQEGSVCCFLLGGYTIGEISRKIKKPCIWVKRRIKSIKEKINGHEARVCAVGTEKKTKQCCSRMVVQRETGRSEMLLGRRSDQRHPQETCSVG